MAEIVAAFGVPHTPMAPGLVEREGPNCETARLFRAVAQHLEAVGPDILIVFDSDHLNTFFFNNLPTFSVGVAGRTEGPNDSNTILTRRPVLVSADLSNQVYRFGVQQGFDLASTQEFEVDHSIMVPLHFLTPRMQIPIVPIFINGLAPPLPAAKRCYALGDAVRHAVGAWSGRETVAILASGSFSLEVAGPKEGVTDQEWMDTVLTSLAAARAQELLEKATTERLLAAGNVSGELLNWIALLGVIGNRRPVFLEPQHGHAYAAWRWDR
ncbi:MAG: extradiol ring-cleavage dioxygenase [Deltaproteobacteria bacterium]|nr:extradiol ring-cleavage dioxygenase [Deltaproteobacteria bacterium]